MTMTSLEKLCLARGIFVALRTISVSDEMALLPEELPSFKNAVVEVRRRSGAARRSARHLLQNFSLLNCAIPKAKSGAPIWPLGIVGSLAHDATVAVAAVASKTVVSSLGIDVEADAPMPAELANRVATPWEQARYPVSVLKSRRLFVAKEAVYKATFPVDGRFLDFQDVDVDFQAGRARTAHGIGVEVVFIEARQRLCALAIIAYD
jgi:4'-phosphopantetheinyl transferase EntD